MAVKPLIKEIDLRGSPTLARYLQSKASVRFVVGPVGSGKTYASCFEIMIKAMLQEPNDAGIRPSRWAIIRNTMPDLKRTTIKTWLSCFPEKTTGKLYKTSPMVHTIHRPAKNWIHGRYWKDQPKDAVAGLDLEVHFFSLDREQDVASLLSFEATGIYFNECREIPKALVNAATDRVGRYPSEASSGVMPSWFGVIGDTNPYDEFHWMYKLEHGDEIEEEDMFEAGSADMGAVLEDMDYEFFRQPPGVYEMEPKPGEEYVWQAIANSNITATGRDYLVRAAGKVWAANPNAENLSNLVIKRPDLKMPAHSKYGYYLSRVNNKELDWIQCYYEGKNTYVREGKPVVHNFNPEFHVIDNLPILKDVPLEGGIDAGGGTLSPAIIIGQRHPLTGAYLVHREFSPEDMGLEHFCDMVLKIITGRFDPDMDLNKFYCDPATKQRDQIYNVVVLETIRDNGIPAFYAPTNDIDTRIEAVKTALGKFDFNKPRLMINRQGCPRLIKGLSGGWHYKKINSSANKPMYRQVPEKDQYSHPCDALCYWLLGSGEVIGLMRRNRSKRDSATTVVSGDFDPLKDLYDARGR